MTELDGAHALGALSFDLSVRPWIGVLRDDGKQHEVSLWQLFAQAGELRRIVGDLPTQEFALLRLLPTIAHDALDGPCDLDEWRDWLWRLCQGRPGARSLGMCGVLARVEPPSLESSSR
ncbi:type I-E CRISPR-associated protein Cse1/CasA [Streptomyces chartreusis]|uniref:type I-E CRISPR-associated protein Cse1/CasA n=1 Tax=Streptomyces chartreusis TaxID=1969 RepID=UPI003D70DD3E